MVLFLLHEPRTSGRAQGVDGGGFGGVLLPANIVVSYRLATAFQHPPHFYRLNVVLPDCLYSVPGITDMSVPFPRFAAVTKHARPLVREPPSRHRRSGRDPWAEGRCAAGAPTFQAVLSYFPANATILELTTHECGQRQANLVHEATTEGHGVFWRVPFPQVGASDVFGWPRLIPIHPITFQQFLLPAAKLLSIGFPFRCVRRYARKFHRRQLALNSDELAPRALAMLLKPISE